MLEDCDPTGETPDPPELAKVEQASRAQGPLINARLAAIDSQVNALSQVDMAIRDVLALYDQAVQQAHYQTSVYQTPVVNPSGAPLNAPSTAVPPNPSYPASYVSVLPQGAPASNVPNVQVRQDNQAPYTQYAQIPQPTYQPQAQVQQDWNQSALQHPAQNY
ncbi:hypothetical protein OESDEN_20950 [Oesophagostomum dentatum]|uniref:Uncharacterized protein n=1 Tax=Oesophagostomum dentatum TaxID=61180 RepID=A0A0B1S381_OESDE|nr:hypothetical protein OESDEN_20950 [Oesophagostomum dentatum]